MIYLTISVIFFSLQLN